MSNMLYKTFFVHKGVEDDVLAGLAMHSGLVTLNKYYKKFNPSHVIMTFDRPNWRKEYTQDKELCLSGKIYKGNRRQKMTKRDEEKYAMFKDHLRDFEEMMRDHTGVITLAAEGLEADDIMAGIAQRFGDDEGVILVSADRDFVQLLRHDNVILMDPASGKDRRIEFEQEFGTKNKHGYNSDVDLYLFNKCLRGDMGDNVGSAYPKIRATRILEAYNDSYKQVNLLNESWTNQLKEEFLVKRLFEENKLLMDLSAQLECVRRLIDDTIDDGLANPGRFDLFQFKKFCSKFSLEKVSKQAHLFTNMLS